MRTSPTTPQATHRYSCLMSSPVADTSGEVHMVGCCGVRPCSTLRAYARGATTARRKHVFGGKGMLARWRTGAALLSRDQMLSMIPASGVRAITLGTFSADPSSTFSGSGRSVKTICELQAQ